MNDTDYCQRFLIQQTHVRGEIVHLSNAYQALFQHQHYPAQVAQLLGEAVVANCLLSETLKISAKLNLQLQNPNNNMLLLAQSTSKRTLRGLVQIPENITPDENAFADFIGGNMLITIYPENSDQEYQGVVALDSTNLAAAIEQYFKQSEQIDTLILLAANATDCAGLLLQRLPNANSQQDLDSWQHLSTLAKTLSHEELLTLENSTILKRLFFQEDVQVFESERLSYLCECSNEKMLNVLSSIEPQELLEILTEQGKIAITCEFCGQSFEYAANDLGELLPQRN